VLLRRWKPALHQRRVDQCCQEREQQVDELAHQERWHRVERARLDWRLHDDATHLCVHGLNDSIDDDAILSAGGVSRPAVADRTSHIFLLKNSAKLSAVWAVRQRRDHGRAAATESATAVTMSDRTG